VRADEAAEAILLAHLKRDIRGCMCGWSELGKSHPGHQVAMLREAALLNDAPVEEGAARAGRAQQRPDLTHLGRGAVVAFLDDIRERVDEIEGSRLQLGEACPRTVWVHTQVQVQEWLRRMAAEVIGGGDRLCACVGNDACGMGVCRNDP
jgi:hypothetical protein